MMEIKKLLEEQEKLNEQTLALSVKSAKVTEKLNKVKIQIHNILLENNLYDYVLYEDSPIYNRFRGIFRKDTVPYKYAGEGDYQKLSIKITEKEVKLFYTETWNFHNKYLFSFPLILLDDTDSLIEYFLDKGFDKLEKIKEKEQLKKENRIATLKAQLNQLENDRNI